MKVERNSRQKQIPWGRLLLLSILALSSLSSCTKKDDSSSSSGITLQLPDFTQAASVSRAVRSASVRATATLSVTRIMVNITASDMSPVTYIWQAQNPGDAPPTSIALDVPSGSARLIQILGALQVTQASFGSAMTFEYGDVTQNLSPGNVSISMSLSSIGGTVGQGTIKGRYLNSDGTAPTGIVYLEYVPVGRPPMIVDQAEIFNGYFDAFAPVGGAQMSYVFEDGTTLFSNLSADGYAVQATNNMRISMPAVYNSSGGNDAQMLLLGYFGPGANSNATCYTPATSLTIANQFSDIALSNPLVWTGSTAPSATQVGVSTGGSPSCSGTEFSNQLKFSASALSTGGSDQWLDFYGPFKINASNTYLTTSYNSASQTMTISWQMLSSASTGLAGIEVFYRIGVTEASTNNPEYRTPNGDGYQCAALPSLGFQSAGRFTTSATSTTISVAAAYATSQFQTVVCPYRMLNVGGVQIISYFQTALSYVASGGGGGGSVPTASLLWAAYAGNSGQYATSVSAQMITSCKAYNILMVDSSGNPVVATSPVTLTISDLGVGGQNLIFYPNTSCTGSAPIQIPTGSSQTTVWVSSNNIESTGYDQISINEIISGTPPVYLSRLVVPLATLSTTPPAPSMAQMSWLPGSLANNGNMFVGGCYGIIGSLSYASSPSLSSGVSSTITMTPPVTGQTYADANCNTIATSLVIPPNEVSGIFYFSPAAVDASGNFSFASPGLSFSPSVLVGAIGTNVPTKLIAALPNSGSGCLPLSMSFENAVGAILTGDTGVNGVITLDASSATGPGAPLIFYSDSACTVSFSTGGTGNVTFTNGLTSPATIFARVTSPGNSAYGQLAATIVSGMTGLSVSGSGTFGLQ